MHAPSTPRHASDPRRARSTSTPDPARLAAAVEQHAQRLDSALRELTSLYTRLHAAAERRRTAIRKADHRAMRDALAEEAAAAGLAARADRHRADAAGALARSLGARGDEQITAGWIAQRLPSPWSERVAAAAADLRAILTKSNEHNAADRLAAETIASHLRGVLQSAAATASQSVTYGAKGAMHSQREPAASVMDLTT